MKNERRRLDSSRYLRPCFDALAPERLSAEALRTIEEGEENGSLACCDISLWEIAMLAAKGRLDPGTDTLSFLKLVFEVRDGSRRPCSHCSSVRFDTPVNAAYWLWP